MCERKKAHPQSLEGMGVLAMGSLAGPDLLSCEVSNSGIRLVELGWSWGGVGVELGWSWGGVGVELGWSWGAGAGLPNAVACFPVLVSCTGSKTKTWPADCNMTALKTSQSK